MEVLILNKSQRRTKNPKVVSIKFWQLAFSRYSIYVAAEISVQAFFHNPTIIIMAGEACANGKDFLLL